MTTKQMEKSFLYKIGVPPTLAWGFLGLLFFMVGDGVETAWISPYLVDNGFTVPQAASLLTVYGVSVAIAAWFSGVLFEIIGARKTMLLGLGIYLAGSIAFIYFGLGSMNLWVMYPTYALRGIGFPLFAYSFLIWINYSSPKQILGRAVGWFWFAYSGGLFVMGAFSSSYLIPLIGHINTLWTSVGWALIGALFAIVVNRDMVKKNPNAEKTTPGKELLNGITIVKEEPKVVIGTILRIVNSVAVFGFPIYLPMYMVTQGYELTTWLQIWGSIFTANIIFNIVIGIVADKIGWMNTIRWIGCVGTGFATLALFYIPQFAPGNVTVLYAVAILFGACLAGFVPLAALVPSLVEDKKGPVMSVFNLGAGLSRFIAPVVVGSLFGIFGMTGVTWVMAGIYFIGAILAGFLTVKKPEVSPQPAVVK